MGTSGTRDPLTQVLVPTFVDEPPTAPAGLPPEEGDADDGEGGPGEGPETGSGTDGEDLGHVEYPAIPAGPGQALGGARGALTRGSRTSDRQALMRGAGRYVRASGGGGGVARSMRSSRMAAGGVAALARAFADRGPEEALRRFDLEALAGGPAEDVFIALTDVLCPPGSTIDEAIARDAMVETVVVFATEGVGSFDGLTAGQLEEFFIGVVSRSIEGKILNEVGTNTVHIPEDAGRVELAQRMLHEFIEGCVRDEFDELGGSLAELEGDRVEEFVSDLYGAAIEMVRVLGEGA